MQQQMTINEYQREAMATRLPGTYDEKRQIIYPALGLAGESGEVADKIKKVLRDHNGFFTPNDTALIALELGDVMWYAAALARDLGYTLEEICQMNLDKLASRQRRGVIQGSGDER